MKDGVTELAKMLKERENKPYTGPQLGVVEVAPPNIKVRLGDVILLDKDDLIIAAHVLAGYARESTFTGEFPTSSVLVGDPHEHQHTVNSPMTGTISTTDTLAVGDEVILIPTGDGQTFFLIDKVVRL